MLAAELPDQDIFAHGCVILRRRCANGSPGSPVYQLRRGIVYHADQRLVDTGITYAFQIAGNVGITPIDADARTLCRHRYHLRCRSHLARDRCDKCTANRAVRQVDAGHPVGADRPCRTLAAQLPSQRPAVGENHDSANHGPGTGALHVGWLRGDDGPSSDSCGIRVWVCLTSRRRGR